MKKKMVSQAVDGSNSALQSVENLKSPETLNDEENAQFSRNIMRVSSRMSALDVNIPVTLTWNDLEIFVKEVRQKSRLSRCCKKKVTKPVKSEEEEYVNIINKFGQPIEGPTAPSAYLTSMNGTNPFILPINDADSINSEDTSPALHKHSKTQMNFSSQDSAQKIASPSDGTSATGAKGWKSSTVEPGDVTNSNIVDPANRCPQGMKQIVFGVNGTVKGGTMLAVMGASGAGKSTLMNILAMRNLKNYTIKGEVRVNGFVVTDEIHNISAYVQQDDLFIGTMTVRETLMFRAYLRLDQRLSAEELAEKVDEVLMEMGLLKCRNAYVGVPGSSKSISGGEAKRLSFACEMLTNPPIMFCDEPTSGLDSFMARTIVRTMQRLVFLHHIVICTIHQPSSEVFALFDKVLLMAEGRVAFMGTSVRAMEFFNSLGHICPSNYNPADFFILTLAVSAEEEETSRRRVATICDAYDQTPEAALMRKPLDQNLATSDELRSKLFSRSRKYQAGWMKQLAVVLWRSWISLNREVVLVRVRIITGLLISFVIGVIFLDLKYDQKGVMNISGAIFALLLVVSFNNLFSVLHTFPPEISLFLRDHGSNLYRCDVYYLAKSIAELPMLIIVPALVVVIAYWMIGLHNDVETFFLAVFYYILVGNVAVSFGHIVSTASADEGVALAMAPPLMTPAMMMGGFFLNADSVRWYLVWIKYTSWFHYGNELVTVNQWKNVENIECDAPTQPQGNNTFAFVPCMFRNGRDVLDHLSFSDVDFEFDVAALFGLWIFFRLMAYIFLLLRAKLTSQ